MIFRFSPLRITQAKRGLENGNCPHNWNYFLLLNKDKDTCSSIELIQINN